MRAVMAVEQEKEGAEPACRAGWPACAAMWRPLSKRKRALNGVAHSLQIDFGALILFMLGIQCQQAAGAGPPRLAEFP